MNGSKSPLLCLVAALLGGGCNAYTPPQPVPPREPTAVSASFGRTWDATIGYFADNNIAIKTIDRSSGLIAAEPAGVPRRDRVRLAECGREGDIRLEPSRVTYNVLVRGDSASSTVQVRATWSSSGTAAFSYSAGVTYPCESSGIFEAEMESVVARRAGAAR